MIKRIFVWLFEVASDLSPVILWLSLTEWRHVFAFLQTDGAFKDQLENARSAFEPVCMLLSLFVLHQKLLKGGSWNFCRDAGEGDQAFVERELEGTPSPKSHAPFPRGSLCDLDNA